MSCSPKLLAAAHSPGVQAQLAIVPREVPCAATPRLAALRTPLEQQVAHLRSEVELLEELAALRKRRRRLEEHAPAMPALISRKLGAVAARCLKGTGLTLADLRRHDRSCPVLVATRKAYYFAARTAGFSLTQIGTFINRDHSAVVSALKARKS